MFVAFLFRVSLDLISFDLNFPIIHKHMVKIISISVSCYVTFVFGGRILVLNVPVICRCLSFPFKVCFSMLLTMRSYGKLAFHVM